MSQEENDVVQQVNMVMMSHIQSEAQVKFR